MGHNYGFGSDEINSEVAQTTKEIGEIVVNKNLGVAIAALTMSLGISLRLIGSHKIEEGFAATVEQLKLLIFVDDNVLSNPRGDKDDGRG